MVDEPYREGYTIELKQDECPNSPREWEPEGNMICWHNRYNLGDKHDFDSSLEMFLHIIESNCKHASELQPIIDYINATDWGREEWDYWFNEYYPERFTSVLPFYLEYIGEYWGVDGERAGLAGGDQMLVNLVGDIAELYADILPLYLYDHSGITMSTGPFACRWDSGQVGYIYGDKGTETSLQSEVDEYDRYLTGDVWGYTIEDDTVDDETGYVDSLWGIYGYDEAIDMINIAIDTYEKHTKLF